VIVELLLKAIAALLVGIANLIPPLAVPQWLTDANGTLQGFIGQVYSLDAWVNVGLGVAVVGAFFACWGVALVIKVVRIVASFITAGGGSAG